MSQRLDPDGDITTTNWATAPLWSKIDDGASTNDADFITMAAGTGARTDTAEVSLTNPASTPGDSNTTVTVRGNRLDTNGDVTTIKCGLYQGATLKGELTGLEAIWLDATISTQTFATSTAITDFNDLRVRITASTPGGEDVDRYDIYWVKVDVSDAASGKKRGPTSVEFW